MKKIFVIILSIVLTFLGLLLGFMVHYGNDNNIPSAKTEVIKKSRSLSMMLETGAGTGVYEATTRSTWPTDGYLFNSELSKCENGGKLSWNDENSTVVMTGSTSDKCYVYFDVYSLTVINSLTEETTSSSIKLTVNATAGTKPITKYYYSKDNGTSYTESTSNTYTFSGLTAFTTYNIKVYVLDENGKSSEVYSKSVKTDNAQMLADYVKSLYTTQGANGLYLHNSSLANSAGDNSYRYAGANPNNYVCFGSDAESCPNDNLYRIIGVFGSQVKLIKADFANSNLLGTDGAYYSNGSYSASSYSTYKGNLLAINRYAWHNGNKHIWSGSDLNKTNLNGTYLTNLGTIWANKIAKTSWKVGGNTWANIAYVTLTNVYQNEIISPVANTTYSAKIGLMYVSDYGSAASLDYWSTNIYSYNSAKNDNWMYMGVVEWTITRVSDRSYCVSRVNITGVLDNYFSGDTGHGIRPTFYLNSDVVYDKGSGTSSDPYKIKL